MNKIFFVGAGPGDPQLLTIRGKELIEKADTILYAGSLVNSEILSYSKKGAILQDTSKMDLQEIREALLKPYKEGKQVVRLASGDPMIFGAVEEMADLLEEESIEIEMVPGVSSFTAAACALKSSLTIPDLAQTVILTRAEGRTKMPPLEKLEDLGKHQSSLILFLSAVLAKSVQEKLLTCYPADTPIAVVYKVSWPDQKIFRGSLSELDSIIRREKITMTALIVVGKFLTAHGYQSKLYDPSFSHAFRRAKSPVERIQT